MGKNINNYNQCQKHKDKRFYDKIFMYFANFKSTTSNSKNRLKY